MEVSLARYGASHHVKVKGAIPISHDAARCALLLALMRRQPYLHDVQMSGPFYLWSLVLRGLLVVALLAIAPLYESVHAMTVAATTQDAMPAVSAHVVSAGSMPDQMPASHLNHDAACRILCFGWVEAETLHRQEGQMTEIVVVLASAQASLLVGIESAPSGHPPKLALFV